MLQGLFRPELLRKRRSSFCGKVQLALPPTHTAWTELALFIGVIISSRIFFGHHTCREYVIGALAPIGGLSSVNARAAGGMTRLMIVDGSQGSVDTPLIEWPRGAVASRWVVPQ